MSKSTQSHHRDVNNILPGLCSILVQSVLNTVLRIRITIFFNRPRKTPAPILGHFYTNQNKHFTHQPKCSLSLQHAPMQ